MKKGKLLFLSLVIMLMTSLATPVEAKTETSVKSLEKQNKALKDENAKLKEQIKSKDKQVKDYKNQLTNKDKEIQTYKSNAATPLKTKLAYQGNVLSGNYQEGKTSVPLLLSYKGIRYTPINKIGDLLKIKTSYDRSKNTLFFGEEPQRGYMSDILEPIVKHNVTVDINKQMDFGGGEIYDKGYSMAYSNGYGGMTFNLDNKYKKITGLLKIDKQSVVKPLNISFVANGTWYKTLRTTGSDGGSISVVNLDVSNVSTLQLAVEGTDSSQSGVVEFANVIIE
ncbi:hypothetical protein [Metabacillus fastidiosus]|uniref:hypothetical protein n=1 Tax=Metabacillus fastidiosus TaxID=1458 RepID=UPI003D2A99FC